MMVVDQEAHDHRALLNVIHEAAAQVGHATLAVRAGDVARAEAHAANALRSLNVVSDELRFGPVEVLA